VSGLAFLLIAVVLSAAGITILWFRSRKPTSWDSGIEEFSRNMQALAPDNRTAPGGRRRRPVRNR
jgi:hypothetical protein